MKSGWKSSEFWVTLVVLGICAVSTFFPNLLPEGSRQEKLVELVVMGLLAAGYTGVRASLKKRTLEVERNGDSEEPPKPAA